MARSIWVALARAARAAERAQKQAVREAQRNQRLRAQAVSRSLVQADRDSRREAREADAAYRAAQVDAAARLTSDVEAEVEMLGNVLRAKPRSRALGLRALTASTDPHALVFTGLRQRFTPVEFRPQTVVGAAPKAPEATEFVTNVQSPGLVARLFGGKARHDEAVATARRADARRLDDARATHATDLARYEQRVAEAKMLHDAAQAARAKEVEEHNASIDAWEADYLAHDPDAVVQYLSHVLDASDYPEDLDESHSCAYNPDARVLTVSYELPPPTAIPSAKAFKYVRAKDEIQEQARSRTEIANLYRHLVGSLTLRTIHELFEATLESHLEAITFHGMVTGVQPATGLTISTCLVSVLVPRDSFVKLRLADVDPMQCLMSLGASVSKKPELLAGVVRVDAGGVVDARYTASSEA